MNNSAYGKTMKNLSKRVKVRLVSSAKDYNRWVSRLCFVSQEIFSRNFVAIHEIRHVLTLYKPVYMGFSILDLSNLIMYEFHYKYIGVKYGENKYGKIKDDVHEDFYEDKSLFDFSNYPKYSRFYDLVH